MENSFEHRYWSLGFSVIGAIVDFISAALIWSNLRPVYEIMSMTYAYNTLDVIWIISLVLLGGLILFTGFLAISAFGMKNMRALGVSMAVFGFVMIGSGLLMTIGMSPTMMGMSKALLIGVVMLIIGALMILRGCWMPLRKARKNEKMLDNTDMTSPDAGTKTSNNNFQK